MSNIAKKAARASASKLGDLAKMLKKTTAGVPDRLGRIRMGRFVPGRPLAGSSGARAAEAMAVDMLEAAGGRVIDRVALRVDDSPIGRELDAAATRGIDRALAFADRHALGTVIVVALAATLIEVEFGLGVMALGTTLLLVTRRGESTRVVIATGGRRALAAARTVYATRRGLTA
ncbi:MAG TPA: hypothetical protein VMG12_21165 [Polyangiaceae bacterium]|nr:hypothetical protein [Polyangiaceae bacterium]